MLLASELTVSTKSKILSMQGTWALTRPAGEYLVLTFIVCEPAVQILVVHLENMQMVSFRSTQTLQSVIDNPGARKTTLTEWLAFNDAYTVGRHLTYLEFPSEVV